MTEALIFGLIGYTCGAFSIALLIGLCFSAFKGDNQLEKPKLTLVWDADDPEGGKAA